MEPQCLQNGLADPFGSGVSQRQSRQRPVSDLTDQLSDDRQAHASFRAGTGETQKL